MRAVLLLARGETNFQSAISSLARVLEEADVSEVLVLAPPGDERAKELVKKFEGLGTRITLKERKTDDRAPLHERLEELRKLASPEDLAIVSPAGASLSAIASRYFKRIAHVTFPFGAWTGNTYPYVLRQYQRVYAIEGERPLEPGKFEPVVEAEGNVRGGPIRRRASELVKEVNKVSGRCFNSYCPDVKLELYLNAYPAGLHAEGVGLSFGAFSQRDELKKQLKKGLNKAYASLAGDRRGEQAFSFLRTLMLTSGLLKAKVEGLADPRKAMILDTSAIFFGLWNWHYLGYRVKVPRCAVYELVHKYEEGIKPYRGTFKLENSLAKFLMEEIREAKLEFPSPPDLCDKAFLQMDPFIIHNTYVVTGDKGIRMVWRGSPLERLAEILWVEGSEEPSEPPSFAFYAFQAFASAELVAEDLKERGVKDVVLEGELRVNGEAVVAFSSLS